MPPPSTLAAAVARMDEAFRQAGHRLSLPGGTDSCHPLPSLYLETKRLLERHYSKISNDWNHPDPREYKRVRKQIGFKLFRARGIHGIETYYTDQEAWEEALRKALPGHAEFLALRFGTTDQKDNEETVNMLVECESQHLWQVPQCTDDGDGDGASRGSSDSVSTAPDAIEAALKLELAGTERRVKLIQDAKKQLQRKLAGMEEAEAAVLKARDAIRQAQMVLTQPDPVLLQSPASSSVVDN